MHFAQLDIVLASEGDVNIFRMEASGLVIDLTLASPAFVRDMSCTLSDQ